MRVTARTTRARHKKFLARTKGYHLGRKNLFRQARQALLKAGTNSYRDRKVNKRVRRRSWIVTIGAAAKTRGLSYSQLMGKLAAANNPLNRRSLATLAKTDPQSFESVVNSTNK